MSRRNIRVVETSVVSIALIDLDLNSFQVLPGLLQQALHVLGNIRCVLLSVNASLVSYFLRLKVAIRLTLKEQH
jgi:hypothetical protein